MVPSRRLTADRLKGDISLESGGMMSEDGFRRRWAQSYAFSCFSLVRRFLRAVLSSELHDVKHSEQLRIAQLRLTILSKKESMRWSFVVTVQSQELISFDRNGQGS